MQMLDELSDTLLKFTTRLLNYMDEKILGGPNTCLKYAECGFVAWRQRGASGIPEEILAQCQKPEKGWLYNAMPLPEDQSCEIPIEECLRLRSDIPIDISIFGPATHRENDVGYPKYSSGRRTSGGGHL
jgi:hypothetical protein